MRKLNCLVLLLFSLGAQAQHFTAKADLKNGGVKGFKLIPLSPLMESYLKYDCADLRLYDLQNKEIPYYIFEENISGKDTIESIDFPIISRKIVAKKYSELIVENPHGAINYLLFSIKNAEVEKNITIEGSTDQKEWYSVKENFTISNISGNRQTQYELAINFPRSDYRYFRILINDSLSAPINVLRAYMSSSRGGAAKYNEISAVKITQNDSSNHRSYVKIDFDQTYRIDAFKLAISSPEFYNREVTIAIMDTIYGKGNIATPWLNEIGYINLNSSSKNFNLLNHFKARSLYLIVENNDNPPLKIESFTGFASQKNLVTFLEENTAYVLKGGNPNLDHPNYDIADFKMENPETLDRIEASSPKPLELKIAKQAVKEDSIFKNKALIWVALGIVGVLLLFVSRKMLRELAN